jgi:3-hydroxyisobutyrate dehydrogenase
MGKRVGFIGLGVMGRPMALNLVAAGHALTVFDLDDAPVQALVEAGAERAASARDAAERSEVVVTMLPASRHVESAMLGPDGVVSGLRPGATVIDMSTIDPGTTRRVAAAVEAKGGKLLDAPVSGSSTGAAEGTLTIMVGGPEAALEEQRDLLEVMGGSVIHCGATGMGETVKLCNNIVAGISVVAVAEAFALGLRAGADPRVMFDVMTKSTGNCWALQKRTPVPGVVEGVPANEGFAPGFMVDLMHKDLGLVMTAAAELRLPLALTAVAQQMYALASAQGHGREDFSAVFKVLEAALPEGPAEL